MKYPTNRWANKTSLQVSKGQKEFLKKSYTSSVTTEKQITNYIEPGMVANSFNPAVAVGSLSLFLPQQAQHFGHGGFLIRTANSSFLCFAVSLKLIIGDKIFILDMEMRTQWGKNGVVVLACLAAIQDEL